MQQVAATELGLPLWILLVAPAISAIAAGGALAWNIVQSKQLRNLNEETASVEYALATFDREVVKSIDAALEIVRSIYKSINVISLDPDIDERNKALDLLIPNVLANIQTALQHCREVDFYLEFQGHPRRFEARLRDVDSESKIDDVIFEHIEKITNSSSSTIASMHGRFLAEMLLTKVAELKSLVTSTGLEIADTERARLKEKR